MDDKPVLISLEFYRAYRTYITVAVLYRSYSMSRTEVRNLAGRRNWRVF